MKLKLFYASWVTTFHNVDGVVLAEDEDSVEDVLIESHQNFEKLTKVTPIDCSNSQIISSFGSRKPGC